MMNTQSTGRIVVVTGLSGSGKSTALKALEDYGYLAIDNLPILLLPKFLAIRKESGGFIRLAVGMDARESDLVQHHENIFDEVRGLGYELSLVFLEAELETLVKRFSESRRPHHLAATGGLMAAIEAEKEYLAPLHHMANHIINTTHIKPQALRDKIIELYSKDGGKRQMVIEVLSFGFKNGLPPEADLMVDVRFLPNPFYVDGLRKLTGRDQPVIDYIMSFPETAEFLTRFGDILTFLVPLYQKEGKSYLTLAVGCTGGQHRSVAVAGFLWDKLNSLYGGSIHLRHRDIV